MLDCNWLCTPTRLFSVQKLWWWMVQFQDRSRSWWSIQPAAHQYQQVFFLLCTYFYPGASATKMLHVWIHYIWSDSFSCQFHILSWTTTHLQYVNLKYFLFIISTPWGLYLGWKSNTVTSSTGFSNTQTTRLLYATCSHICKLCILYAVPVKNYTLV